MPSSWRSAGRPVPLQHGPARAAGLEAAMCACFVVLLHIPRVIAAPTSQIEWTMTCIALSITGAAWIIRSYTNTPVSVLVTRPERAGT
jgi:hypothetical protein